MLVRYPASGMTHETPRRDWPWMPGMVEEVCGPNEWLIAVESRDVAVLEDGSAAPADADEEDIFYPMAFRDASEIRSAK